MLGKEISFTLSVGVYTMDINMDFFKELNVEIVHYLGIESLGICPKNTTPCKRGTYISTFIVSSIHITYE